MSKERIELLASAIRHVFEEAQRIQDFTSDIASRLQRIESQMSELEQSISGRGPVSAGQSSKYDVPQHVLRSMTEIMTALSKLEIIAGKLEHRISTIESYQDK